MTITAQLADGRTLEFPDGTDPAVVQRTVKSVLGKADQPVLTPEWHKKMAESATRGEHPVLAKVADFATGMSGSLRGTANLLEQGYNKVTGKSDATLESLITGEKPAPLGEKIWPKAPGSEGTGAKLLGSIADPIPWLVAGGVGKIAPYAPMTGGGYLKGAQALATNTLSGATAGGIIGGLSDEGDAASGAVVGGVLGGGIPLVGAAGKWTGDLIRNAAAPATQAGRTGLARKFFAENLGPARQQVADALTTAQPIVAGSPMTAADAIAAANVGKTDKFGSALVAAQDALSKQSAQGISDTAKTIAARQEAARAGEIANIAQTPSDLASAVAARKAASKVNYPAAFQQQVRVDNDLMAMSENPYFKGAFSDAMRVAQAREVRTGKPLGLTEQLHLLKLSLDKRLSRTGDTALSSTEKAEVAKLQDQLVAWLGKQNPQYEAARAAHEVASKPINQMKLGQDLQAALQSPVSGAERATSFANTVRTAGSKVSKATGKPRMADFTADQQAAVKRVSDELARNAEKESLGSGVNVKNLFDIAERGKAAVHIPNLLSRPAMLTNWLMSRVGNSADDLIAQDVGKMLLTDPAGFAAKYLTDVPPSQRAIVMEQMRKTLSPIAPYARASAVSASQNGE